MCLAALLPDESLHHNQEPLPILKVLTQLCATSSDGGFPGCVTKSPSGTSGVSSGASDRCPAAHLRIRSSE